MTQIKITFDDIRKGDEIETVWHEDNYIQRSVGVADHMGSNSSGRARTWLDATEHNVADNWSRNQERVTFWLSPNPYYKTGDLLNVKLTRGSDRTQVVQVSKFKGRKMGRDQYEGVIENGYGVGFEETDVVGRFEPPFKVGDVVQTKSKRRKGKVIEGYKTFSTIRIQWEDNGRPDVQPFDTVEAYEEPKPVEVETSQLHPLDRVRRTQTGLVGTVVRSSFMDDSWYHVRYDRSGETIVEEREHLVLLHSPKAQEEAKKVVEAQVEEIDEVRAELVQVVEEAQETLRQLKERKRKLLSDARDGKVEA